MRVDWEKWEEDYLATWASKSSLTLGRQRPEEECVVRTAYQRDRDRIIHCKSFRRLKHKTQVFIAPKSDHHRTRLTHTLEVAQISRTIARALRLNEDLTEAIALGHDLGHTPFGHSGERALASLSLGFSHNKQSWRVVRLLENEGCGLNLTSEVEDGIMQHTSKGSPRTLEGKIIQLSDRIAYVNHDIDDAIRAGIITEVDLPKAPCALLGDAKSKRIHTMVLDVIMTSEGNPLVSMSPPCYEAMSQLRKFLFESVYFRPQACVEEERYQKIIRDFYLYYMENFEELPQEYRQRTKQEAVCDYIAGMTDTFALDEHMRIFLS